MRIVLPIVFVSLLTGCSLARGIVSSDLKSYCQQTEATLSRHVDALIEEKPPRSLVTGDAYVTERDKACEAVDA